MKTNESKFNWNLPLYGAIGFGGGCIFGFAIGLIIAYAVNEILGICIAVVIWGAMSGASLGLALKDKNKILYLMGAGVIAPVAGLIIVFLPLIMIVALGYYATSADPYSSHPFITIGLALVGALYGAVVGGVFGLVFKNKKKIPYSACGGAAGVLIGTAIAWCMLGIIEEPLESAVMSIIGDGTENYFFAGDIVSVVMAAIVSVIAGASIGLAIAYSTTKEEEPKRKEEPTRKEEPEQKEQINVEMEDSKSKVNWKLLDWKLPLYCAIGFGIGGIALFPGVILGPILGGAALGLALKKDKNKILHLSLAGAVGSIIGIIIIILPLVVLTALSEGFLSLTIGIILIGGVYGAVVAGALGLVLKDKKKVGYLACAGSVGGAVGAAVLWLLTNPHHGIAMSILGYGTDTIINDIVGVVVNVIAATILGAAIGFALAYTMEKEKGKQR